MEESGFLREIFPRGLKVLLVGIDNDTQNLIKRYLPQPFYEIAALDPQDTRPISLLLAERAIYFDLVISDVVLTQIYGYQFIRDQRLETNIPHVLICRNYDEMLKAFRYGACYVLLKPLSEAELKNLWQHICTSKEQRMREIIETEQQHKIIENEQQQPHSDVEDSDQIRQNLNPDPNSDVEVPDQIRQNLNPDKDETVVVNTGEFINYYVGASSSKKRQRRIVWTPELHKDFLDAVEKLGGAEKAVPKAILEAMEKPFLGRENVASHLQKYRIHLKKKRTKELQQCLDLMMPVDRIPPSSLGETSYRRFDNTNDNEESVLEPCTTQHFTNAQYHQFQHEFAGLQMLTQKQAGQSFNYYGHEFPQSRLPSSSFSAMLPLNQNLAPCDVPPSSLVSATLPLNQNLAPLDVPPIRGGNGGIITPEASNDDDHLVAAGFRRIEKMNQDKW